MLPKAKVSNILSMPFLHREVFVRNKYMKYKSMDDTIEHVRCFLLKIRKVKAHRHNFAVIIKHT